MKIDENLVKSFGTLGQGKDTEKGYIYPPEKEGAYKAKLIGISVIPMLDDFVQSGDKLNFKFGAELASTHKLDLDDDDVAMLLKPNYSVLQNKMEIYEEKYQRILFEGAGSLAASLSAVSLVALTLF